MRPKQGPSLRPGPDESENNIPLLQSVLTFYERFARRNETNSELQSEAARAYSRVSALYERLGRDQDAAKANQRALEMLEDLIKEFPSIPKYRFQLVELSIMADPRQAKISSLESIEQQLRQARTHIDQLAIESPGNLEYLQAQIHAYAKLGAVEERLSRPDKAQTLYRQAIVFASELIESDPASERAWVDRVDIREALAAIFIAQNREAQARPLLDAAIEDLQVFIDGPSISGFIADRLAILAEDYRKIGETERADEIAGWIRR